MSAMLGMHMMKLASDYSSGEDLVGSHTCKWLWFVCSWACHSDGIRRGKRCAVEVLIEEECRGLDDRWSKVSGWFSSNGQLGSDEGRVPPNASREVVVGQAERECNAI